MFEKLRRKILLLIITISLSASCLAQSAVVKGIVHDNSGEPIENAVIRGTDFDQQTISNVHGQFSISVPSNRDIKLHFQSLCCQDTLIAFHLKPKETATVNVTLHITGDIMEEVVIKRLSQTLQVIAITSTHTLHLVST